jgi:aminoglycoside 6'-N-acetyltransferase I
MLMSILGRPEVAADAPAERRIFLDYLADPVSHVYVAEIAGAAVGAASLVVRPRLNWPTPEAWIPDLVVRPEARRRGVGRALLDACAEEARRCSCHVLRLDCGVERTEAQRLYDAYGFVRAGYDYQLRLAG